MNISPKEIEAILSQTPDIPENDGLIATLKGLYSAASVVKYPFTYNAQFFTAGAASNIAAGATVTVNVQIDAGSPFLIISQSYYNNTANAAETVSTLDIPNIMVLLTDSGTNRQLMDVATPVNCIFGNGQFPYVLPEPKLMQANSLLTIAATNRDAAVGYNLYLAFNGYKLYKV